ncbi:MAG: hypothetical protein K0U93_09150, partial [Gammaproteobacteria bacterium]|nr:hypothetical protein [Gammaproteobacteria bacterium]
MTTTAQQSTLVDSAPVLAADGRPLKVSLARALRRQRLRALALIAPTTALADGAGSPAPELELPPDVEVVGSWGKWLKVQVPLGRVYGNATTTHGIVAITGGTLDDV